MRADTHDGPEQKCSTKRPDTLMQLSRSSLSEIHLATRGRAIQIGTLQSKACSMVCPQLLAKADIRAIRGHSGFDLGCVKTLRGITAPGILGTVVMRRAKKRKNLSSAWHYNQIRFRFHTTKTQRGSRVSKIAVMHNTLSIADMVGWSPRPEGEP